MATGSLSFKEDLWEGIEAVKEKTEVGLESCKDVLEFFKRLAVLEEEYSKNVNKLLQRYQNSPTSTTLGQGWKGIISVLEGQGSVHKGLSTNITTNLCHPLQALLKDMENRRRVLVFEGTKHKSDLKDNLELVKKAKTKYEKLSKDLELARTEYYSTKATVTDTNPQTAKIDKLEKKMTAVEQEVNAAEGLYKTQVSIYNNFLDQHQQEKWPYVLNEFEQFEVTRISFMKANIHNFLGLLKEMPSVLEAEVSAGLVASEHIDPEKDIQLFIQSHKTQKELLQPIAFEPYPEKIILKSTATTPSTSRPISQLWDNISFRLSGGPPKEEPKVPSIFGVSLADLMEKQKTTYPDLRVPKILVALTEGIISLNGLNAEGIFRLAGSASEVQTLRKQLDKEDYNVTSVGDVHVLGTTLKQFLRELPESVIPTSFYDECVGHTTTPVELLGKLPPLHRHVLVYIINFLQLFIKPDFVKYNKMNSANLATIFSQILLRSPQKDPTALLAGLTSEMGFIERLIATAPPIDDAMFPILAGLHSRPSSTPPSHTTPSNLASSTSSLGDVACSTLASHTDDPLASFEDMSNRGEDEQISDFSDHSEGEKEKEKAEGRQGEGEERTGEEEAKKGEGEDFASPSSSTDQLERLGSSEELPEFVFVPTSSSQ